MWQTTYRANTTSEIYIESAIQEGTTIIVSDGSFKDHRGTAALITEV